MKYRRKTYHDPFGITGLVDGDIWAIAEKLSYAETLVLVSALNRLSFFEDKAEKDLL